MRNNKPIVVCDQDIPHLPGWLSESCCLINYQAGALSADALTSADGLIVRSVTVVNAALLNNSPCRWVGSVTAGKNHLDEAALDAAGIAWSHAPGGNAPAVCEYILSALSLAQQNGRLDSQATVAVIGVGQVGSRVVAACEQLGFRVIRYDPPREVREAGFCSATWDEVATCECLVICASYTKSGIWPSHELINEALLKQCTNLRAMINAARGEIIDYKALFSLPVWTCLDVWPNEPAINKNWVTQADIATPHIAGYSVQSKWRLSAMIYDSCSQFFNLPKQEVSMPQPGRGSIDLEATSQTMKAAIVKDNTPTVFHALRKNYPLRSEI